VSEECATSASFINGSCSNVSGRNVVYSADSENAGSCHQSSSSMTQLDCTSKLTTAYDSSHTPVKCTAAELRSKSSADVPQVTLSTPTTSRSVVPAGEVNK